MPKNKRILKTFEVRFFQHAQQDDHSLLHTAGKAQRRGARSFLPLVAIAVAIIVWWIVTALHVFSPIILPSPLSVLADVWTLLTTGFGNKTLLDDIWISTLRILIGFIAAVVIGVPLGIFMARNETIFQLIDPFLQFIRSIPPLAYIPLLVFWFGIGEMPKILLIIIGTIPVIIINTVSGVRSIPPQRMRVAQCLGATPYQLFRHTILPSALPEIFTSMRVGIGVAWTCLVAAELLAADAGLGWLIQTAGQQLQVGFIFVGIIVIGILGYIMELLIRLLEKAVVPWKGRV